MAMIIHCVKTKESTMFLLGEPPASQKAPETPEGRPAPEGA
jgi:hypothetical protein